MSNSGKVISVNVSEGKGTVKNPVKEIEIDMTGIVGDAHSGPWRRQVSLLSQEHIDAFIEQTGRATRPGEFAENITVSGLDLNCAAPLDRLRIGDAELEVTQIGKTCHGESCAVFREVGKCVMPTEGVFCRVIRGGRVRPGDQADHFARPLRFLVITLSDRAFAGQYEDKSGPRAKEIIEAFLAGKRWHGRIQTALLPDDPQMLDRKLTEAVDAEVDAILALGGTGVGPRDITPEAIMRVCDKMVPGIMENIRVKFGSRKPAALLSRSVAGIRGITQIYGIPGSPRAVEEYLGEILKTLEHILLTIHGLDIH